MKLYDDCYDERYSRKKKMAHTKYKKCEHTFSSTVAAGLLRTRKNHSCIWPWSVLESDTHNRREIFRYPRGKMQGLKTWLICRVLEFTGGEKNNNDRQRRPFFAFPATGKPSKVRKKSRRIFKIRHWILKELKNLHWYWNYVLGTDWYHCPRYHHLIDEKAKKAPRYRLC